MTPTRSTSASAGRLAVIAALAVGVAVVEAGARDSVPPPSQTPAEVIVSGRTSTMKSIRIVNVGRHVPDNFGSRTKDTPGFTWYVSQHYALKTNLGERAADEKPGAHDLLTWLELAYPHYVELFGREPVGIDEKRMVVVYARSERDLKKVLAADGYSTGVAGGVTYTGTSYQYPSTLYYHQRYIVIHECTHLFQRCVSAGGTWSSPLWFFEGIADSMASHVYDEAKKRLTVHVLDKGTKGNYLAAGHSYLEKKPKTAKQIHDDYADEYGDEPRGAWFMLVHYLAFSDPQRSAAFTTYSGEMLERSSARELREESGALLEKLYGSWPAIDDGFRAWCAACPSTFQHRSWLWEQTGDMYWNRGDYSHGKVMRLDVRLAPSDGPAFSPFRMDYPLAPVPPFVGPVRRGVDEPSVGCLLDLSARPRRGQVGFGLGVSEGGAAGEREGFVGILIDEGRRLLVDGSALGVASKTVPIPDDVAREMEGNGHRLGLTVTIARRELRVAMRTEKAESVTTVPLDAAQRRQLMDRPLALLGGKYNWNGITPCFDERRRAEPDLSIPAPANRWRNPGHARLRGLGEATRRLGARPVPSLAGLHKTMAAAAPGDRAAQRKAITDYDRRIARVLRDVGARVRDAGLVRRVLVDLSQVSVFVEVDDGGPGDRLELRAEVTGPVAGLVEGTLRYEAKPPDAVDEVPDGVPVRVAPGERAASRAVLRLVDATSPVSVGVRCELSWYGQRLVLRETRSLFTSIPQWMVVGPFDNPGGHAADVKHPPEEGVRLDGTYRGKGGRRIGWREVKRGPGIRLTDEHRIDLRQLCGPEGDVAAYAFVWVESPNERDAVLALGSDDGVVVWLDGKRAHANLVPRGYSSREDRVPIRLKAGRNALLLKITQGGGGWCFGAHLEDARGGPLEGVKTSLDPARE